MNTAIILAGGNGSRMGNVDIPKQYIEVGGKPLICYCLQTFEHNVCVDRIIIVADDSFHLYLEEWLKRENISKFAGFARPGRTRQHSIYNGLKAVEPTADSDEIVIIHDAARPCVSDRIITEVIERAVNSQGAMPVITVKDTMYISEDGKSVSGMLDRDKLYAGQAPESFRFAEYLSANESLSEDEMAAVHGSSEPACRYGMKIELVEGSEDNFKITTMADLERFENILHLIKG